MAIDKLDLARRHAQLADLRRYLDAQEREFATRRAQLQAFVDRYTGSLESLHLELDALESRIHDTTCRLVEGLRRHGIELPAPRAPQASALPVLPFLPSGAALPAEPQHALIELEAPSLKTLYRRAAKRLHPDRAVNEAERLACEQGMMAANNAYAAQDRATLEQLLLAAGEDVVRVHGGSADAQRHWLKTCENAVQARLRVVRAHRAALEANPVRSLSEAIERAESQGLDPFGVMATRLRSLIRERRQELYIGERLNADSRLAPDFVQRFASRSHAASRGSMSWQ